jgi:hypothetical protein
MIRRIPEAELIAPTLLLLYDAPNGELTTSKLIYLLEHYFLPGGEDAEILEGRSDSKFSQKVRNLKSHNAYPVGSAANNIW